MVGFNTRQGIWHYPSIHGRGSGSKRSIHGRGWSHTRQGVLHTEWDEIFLLIGSDFETNQVPHALRSRIFPGKHFTEKWKSAKLSQNRSFPFSDLSQSLQNIFTRQ